MDGWGRQHTRGGEGVERGGNLSSMLGGGGGRAPYCRWVGTLSGVRLLAGGLRLLVETESDLGRDRDATSFRIGGVLGA